MEFRALLDADVCKSKYCPIVAVPRIKKQCVTYLSKKNCYMQYKIKRNCLLLHGSKIVLKFGGIT